MEPLLRDLLAERTQESHLIVAQQDDCVGESVGEQSNVPGELTEVEEVRKDPDAEDPMSHVEGSLDTRTIRN